MKQNRVEAGVIQVYGVYQAGFSQTQSYTSALEAQAQAKKKHSCADRQADRQTDSLTDGLLSQHTVLGGVARHKWASVIASPWRYSHP